MTHKEFFVAVYLQFASQGVDSNICISRAVAAVDALKLVSNR